MSWTKKPPKCKFCGKTGHSKWQCFEYLKTKRSEAPGERKSPKMVSNSSKRLKALREADSAFSEYIRRKYADEFGRVVCYTCGKVLDWRDADCSHYVERRSMSTRFDENNVRVCCKVCNQYNHGELQTFRCKLVSELGEPTVRDLESKKFKEHKLTTRDLEDITLKYQEKTKILILDRDK